MTLPSKELLSAIFNKPIGTITEVSFDNQRNRIEYQELKRYWESINIYELAHKCKEWAFEQGYELFSRILSNDHQMTGNCLVIRVESDPETVLKITNGSTEPEAIFLACNWILENKEEI